MENQNFRLEASDGAARAGIFQTRRGEVQTPFFMTIATGGAVKGAVSMSEARDAGTQVLLCNTYHLHLRPGSSLVQQMGGLHQFIGWDGPILTDSGGYQVFSLNRKKITDEKVIFRSHIDGAKVEMRPEDSIQIQLNLDSDILMVLDECPPNVPNFHKIRRAVERTTQWAERCKTYFQQKYDFNTPVTERPQLFGIVQGGCFPELREQSLHEITGLGFDGYALGGLAVGESTEEMYSVLDEMVHQMPGSRPRYLMGVGKPENLLESIERGVDMFDCVLPMRNARHGTIFTSRGTLPLENAQYRTDEKVLDPACDCATCRAGYSRAYLHHLIRAKEMLGFRLCTVHNVHFYQSLIRDAREHIVAGNFSTWKKEVLTQLKAGE